MKITTTSQGHTVTRLEGRFDAHKCDAFNEHVAKAVPGQMLLDLSQIEFIDSSALAALVALSRDARFELMIINPSDPVRVILELTAIDQVLTIVETVGAAPDREPGSAAQGG